MPTVTLRIPPQAEHVRTARLVAGAAARRCGVDETVLDEVRLVVGEACARAVVRHQYASVDSDIRLELRDDNERFAVEVHDQAADTDDPDDQMALALISALAPESAVEPEAPGTIVRMSWPVTSPSTPPPA